MWDKWRNFKNSLRETLCVYDFDHTLVHTECKIRLTESRIPIPQDEYESRVKSKGYLDRHEFDFDDYNHVLEPKPVQKVVESLKNDLKNNEDCWILTARHSVEPIFNYLPAILGEYYAIPCVAVNSPDYPGLERSDSEKKADWIRHKIYEGYQKVRLFEDSYENAKAIWELKEEFPDLELEVYLVTQENGEDCVQSLEELEKYQQIQQKKHPKAKKRLIGLGNQPQGDVYSEKPSFKRSKSAPPGAGGT